MFAYAAKGEFNQTSRDTIGIFLVNRSMRGHLHVQEREEALIKSAIQLTRYENRMVFMLQNSMIGNQ